MKIENVRFPENITSAFGLKPIIMSRLGKVVLIAGRNGSGKSRFLGLLKKKIDNYPNVKEIENLEKALIINQRSIENHHRNIATLETLAPSDEQNEIRLNARKRNLSKLEQTNQTQLDRLNEKNHLSLHSRIEDLNTLNFVPKNLYLSDSYDMSSQNIESAANQIYIGGTDNIAGGAIPAIELIQRRWTNANTSTAKDIDITDAQREKINVDYEKLRSYIALFLGTELKRDSNGNAMLFNKRVGLANLSDGQKILLQFCLALFGQETQLENLIIFMDEPENHLHPAALIEVLDKIIPNVTNGQIWIATHSINVLAHFDPSCIWYMENGEISYAGNIPNKVLEGLLGKEEEISRLSNFLSLPAQMASTQFAFECLLNAQVVITGNTDPQVNQIHKIISERIQSGNKLKILDFGMGKGRLLSTIYENEKEQGIKTSDWLDFYGYDANDANKDVCTKILHDIYGDGLRYFNDSTKALTILQENSFDVIVMCNVFHEIEPSLWLPLFTSHTSIFKLLKEDGVLLIVEDQLLAVGEKAHSKGFLVFDELEFKKLFKMDAIKTVDHRGDGRLKAHQIPKKYLSMIDTESKKDALKTLLENAKANIKKLRSEDSSFKNGKLHGFWAQQLANATLALQEL